MYQYEGGGGGGVAGGFSAAINLSVKCMSAGLKTPAEPRSPGTTSSVMDLSTSSVTSTSPQVTFVSYKVLKFQESRYFRSSFDRDIVPLRIETIKFVKSHLCLVF